MKICHVTSVHDSLDDRIFVRECRSISKVKDFDVYIVGPGDDKQVDDVHIIGVGAKPNSRWERIKKYNKIVIKTALQIDADLYHIHDPELLLWAHMFKNNGKHVVFDSHEDYAAQIRTKGYLPRPIRNFISFLYHKFENHICRNYLDGAIFPCLVDGKDIFEGRVKHHELIDNRPVSEEIEKADLKAQKGSIYVCCAGGLTKERGIEQLIDACFIANIKLVLAGKFDDSEFEKKIMNKGSFEIVDFRGQCSRSEVQEIYNGATIGASTILHEGQYPRIWNLPTKVYEYMMHGLPFVISDFEYCKKIVEKYKCGIIVKPEDPKSIANGIRILVEDEGKRLEMGRRGREAIIGTLNWKNEEKKLLSFYEKILLG